MLGTSLSTLNPSGTGLSVVRSFLRILRPSKASPSAEGVFLRKAFLLPLPREETSSKTASSLFPATGVVSAFNLVDGCWTDFIDLDFDDILPDSLGFESLTLGLRGSIALIALELLAGVTCCSEFIPVGWTVLGASERSLRANEAVGGSPSDCISMTASFSFTIIRSTSEDEFTVDFRGSDYSGGWSFVGELIQVYFAVQ